jgi:hypothetical protein
MSHDPDWDALLAREKVEVSGLLLQTLVDALMERCEAGQLSREEFRAFVEASELLIAVGDRAERRSRAWWRTCMAWDHQQVPSDQWAAFCRETWPEMEQGRCDLEVELWHRFHPGQRPQRPRYFPGPTRDEGRQGMAEP